MCGFVARFWTLDELSQQRVVDCRFDLCSVLLLIWAEQAEALVEFQPEGRAASFPCSRSGLNPVSLLLPVRSVIWCTLG